MLLITKLNQPHQQQMESSCQGDGQECDDMTGGPGKSGWVSVRLGSPDDKLSVDDPINM